MADLVQRYAHAATSSNLKVDEYHMDADVLMAVAMSGGLAASMSRIKYLKDATCYRPLLLAWTGVVGKKATLRHWREDWSPVRVAKISLDYWLTDQCPACQGTGFPVLQGIPTRSPKACATCNGQGRRPLDCERRMRDPVLDMYEDLCAIFDKSRQRASLKLRGERRAKP